MAELKREYVVPLRRKTKLAPKWRRSKKAVSVLKDFIRKHMKTDNIVICPELNEKIWEKGIKNPPGKVSVIAYKFDFQKEEKTLVNLLDIGVEKYVEKYKVSEEKEVKKEVKENIKDAQVVEKEKTKSLEEEVKNNIEEEKEKPKKEEVKKDE